MCQCAIYAQDLHKIVLFLQCAIYERKIVLTSSMYNICTRFAQDCTSFSNAQYMCKICARLYLFPQCARLYLFLQCAIYAQYMRKICARLYLFLQCAINAQDLHKMVLISSMCNICTRSYLFFQCTIYAQDLRKIVLISPMHNICARFAQDCTSLPNVQYFHKIAGIIGRNMPTYHISALNLEWYSLHCYFWIATSSDFFLNKHL